MKNANAKNAIRIARLLLLLAAAGATVMAVVATRRRPAEVAVDGASYVCPMHPQMRSASPGECGICRMALVPRAAGRTAGPGSAAAPSTFTLPPDVPPLPGYVFNQANRVLVSRDIVAPASLDGSGGGTALLYRDEVEWLEPEERASFVPAGAGPAGELPVRVLHDRPLDWDDATVRVRFELLDPAPQDRVGTVGWLALARRTRAALLVPLAAVVRAPDGHVVFVPSVDGQAFLRRKVILGRAVFGMVDIVAGLSAGEKIVTASAPFLEAERVNAAQELP